MVEIIELTNEASALFAKIARELGRNDALRVWAAAVSKRKPGRPKGTNTKRWYVDDADVLRRFDALKEQFPKARDYTLARQVALPLEKAAPVISLGYETDSFVRRIIRHVRRRDAERQKSPGQ